MKTRVVLFAMFIACFAAPLGAVPEKKIQDWIKQLSSRDEDVRRKAELYLLFDADVTVPALLKAWDHENEKTRAAVRALVMRIAIMGDDAAKAEVQKAAPKLLSEVTEQQVKDVVVKSFWPGRVGTDKKGEITSIQLPGSLVEPDKFELVMPYLKHFKSLEEILLDGGKVGDKTLEPLAAVTSLRKLDIRGGKLSAAAVAQIAKIKSLKELRMDNTKLTDETVAPLGELTGLERLELFANNDMGDAAFAVAGKMKGLKWLDLGGTNLTSKGLVHLKELKALEYFNPMYLSGEEGLEHLESLTALKSFTVSFASPSITKHVAKLKKLERLNVAHNNITDDDLKPLGELTELRWLNLADNKITNAGLSHLKPLTNLKELWLSDKDIDDAGMTHLVELPAIATLFLNDCPVTDAGLETLSKIKTLKSVQINDSKVTRAGVVAFRKALPRCKIGGSPFAAFE